MCSLNVSKGICGADDFSYVDIYIHLIFMYRCMNLHVSTCWSIYKARGQQTTPPPKNCITLETVEFKFEYTRRYFSHPFQRTFNNFAILTNCNCFCHFQMVHMLEGNIFKEFTCSDWFKVLLRVEAP